MSSLRMSYSMEPFLWTQEGHAGVLIAIVLVITRVMMARRGRSVYLQLRMTSRTAAKTLRRATAIRNASRPACTVRVCQFRNMMLGDLQSDLKPIARHRPTVSPMAPMSDYPQETGGPQG